MQFIYFPYFASLRFHISFIVWRQISMLRFHFLFVSICFGTSSKTQYIALRVCFVYRRTCLIRLVASTATTLVDGWILQSIPGLIYLSVVHLAALYTCHVSGWLSIVVPLTSDAAGYSNRTKLDFPKSVECAFAIYPTSPSLSSLLQRIFTLLVFYYVLIFYRSSVGNSNIICNFHFLFRLTQFFQRVSQVPLFVRISFQITYELRRIIQRFLFFIFI